MSRTKRYRYPLFLIDVLWCGKCRGKRAHSVLEDGVFACSECGHTTRSPGRKSALEVVLDERFTPWEGALYTRRTLLTQLLEERKSDAYIDRWVFSRDALSDEQIEAMYERGELINRVPDELPDWYLAVSRRDRERGTPPPPVQMSLDLLLRSPERGES